MLHAKRRENIKVLLLEGIHQSGVNTFIKNGISNITEVKEALSKDDLIDLVRCHDILGIRSRTQLTEDVLKESAHLMAIGCFCIGTNQVSLKSAAANGTPVFNAPHANTRSVAELVIGEILMLIRQVPMLSADLHRGVWNKTAKGSYELRGKKLGIIGYGHIGSQLSILAEALGLQVSYYDIEPKLPLGNAVEVDSLSSILSDSDIISIHVPETEQTKNMFNSDILGKMKKGSILINASRGSVVDLPVLSELIKSGHIKSAAIDVFPVEPKTNNDPFSSPLQGLSQVILTPHVGGSTVEAQKNIGIDVSTKMAKFILNGSTTAAVNFPQLNLSRYENVHRILHIHENVPGILLSINEIIAAEKINILGQHLNTRDSIGYAVLDIEVGNYDRILEKLGSIKGTIKTRALS